jgi:hypothetical protein
MEAADAADRAWLKEKEPLILADPVLAKFYCELILKENCAASTALSQKYAAPVCGSAAE